MATKTAVRPSIPAVIVEVDGKSYRVTAEGGGSWRVSSATQDGDWRVYEHPSCGLRCACPGFTHRNTCRHLTAVRQSIAEAKGEQRATGAEGGRNVARSVVVAGDIRSDSGPVEAGQGVAAAAGAPYRAASGRQPWAVGRVEGGGALLTVWPAEGPHKGHEVAVRRVSEGCAVRCRECGDAAGYFERSTHGKEVGAANLAPERYELPSATAATRAAVGGQWRGGRDIL